MNESPTLDSIHDAIQRGDIRYIERALESGFDPNTKDAKQCTPLIFACEHQNPDIVKLLLLHGADPSHRESAGYDAAGVAAWHGEYRMGAYTEESKEIQKILNDHNSA